MSKDSESMRGRFEKAMRRKSMSQTELAKNVGANRAYLSRMLSGEKPGNRIWPLIAQALDVPIEWLTVGDNPPSWYIDNFADQAQNPVELNAHEPAHIDTPLFTYKLVPSNRAQIMALEGVTMGNGSNISVIDKPYIVDELRSRGDIAIAKASGDSMEGTLSDGDRVVLQVFAEPVGLSILDGGYITRSQIEPYVQHKCIALVSINDEDPTLKRVVYQASPGNRWHMMIMADNSAWGLDNGYPRYISKTDSVVFYAKMLGKGVF